MHLGQTMGNAVIPRCMGEVLCSIAHLQLPRSQTGAWHMVATQKTFVEWEIKLRPMPFRCLHLRGRRHVRRPVLHRCKWSRCAKRGTSKVLHHRGRDSFCVRSWSESLRGEGSSSAGIWWTGLSRCAETCYLSLQLYHLTYSCWKFENCDFKKLSSSMWEYLQRKYQAKLLVIKHTCCL